MSHHVNIKIGAVGDPPLFPELREHISREGSINHVTILERGTTSGKTSMAFYITLPNGEIVFAQMTADTLLAIASAAKGAMERFGS